MVGGNHKVSRLSRVVGKAIGAASLGVTAVM